MKTALFSSPPRGIWCSSVPALGICSSKQGKNNANARALARGEGCISWKHSVPRELVVPIFSKISRGSTVYAGFFSFPVSSHKVKTAGLRTNSCFARKGVVADLCTASIRGNVKIKSKIQHSSPVNAPCI